MLLSQAAGGNEEAFARLFHLYKDKLFLFLYRISGSKETAEDIIQDVFLKMWLQKDRLSAIDNFNAFLFRATRNHMINQLRRMSKERLARMESLKRKNPVHLPDAQLGLKNLQQSLNEIIAQLPPQQQNVYRLSREKNLKQEEIARQLGISISTLQNHLTRALKTIQEELRKRLD